MRTFQLAVVAVYLYLHQLESANILGVFIIPSISHQMVFQTVCKELSLRGHHVTILTTDPLNNPKLVNLSEVDLGFTYEVWRKHNIQTTLHKDLSMTKIIANIYELLGLVAEAEISHPAVQALVNNGSKKFDVMLVEFVHPLMYALSAKFNCPMIGITSFGAFITGHDAVGNPSHPALNPDLVLQFVGGLGFFDRIYSLYFSVWIRYFYHFYVLPKYDKIARKFVGENIPYLGDIEKNVSLLFLNVNPILYSIRPNVPAVIELGNLHFKTRKPLPADIQKQLDDAKEGAVYVSFGTNIRFASLPLNIRRKAIEVLGNLPYKIFFKWEDDDLPGQPKNVIIRKWFPQQDLLGHPNIKVFLMQGGLQSLEEAILNGVPLAIMPFLGDQPFNARRMADLGVAEIVDIEKMTKEQLIKILTEVAENPKYRNKVKEISDLISDTPMTGLEKAVWWTEYVIRHKGARHLRSPAIDLPLYQYLLLDVMGFILVTFLILTYSIYLSIRLTKTRLYQTKLKST